MSSILHKILDNTIRRIISFLCAKHISSRTIIISLDNMFFSYKTITVRLKSFRGLLYNSPMNNALQIFSFSLNDLKDGHPLVIIVPAAKVNSCFKEVQVQASGFVKNLHLPVSDSIFHKKPAFSNTTFLCHQNNNDRPDRKTHNIK